MATPSQTSAPISLRPEDFRLGRIALGTVLVMVVLLGFGLLYQLQDVIVAIFLGILLATALRPLALRMRSIKISRHISAFFAVLILVVLVVGALVAVLPTFVAQGQLLYSEVPTLYSNVRGYLAESNYSILRQFGGSLEPTLDVQPGFNLQDSLSQVSSTLPSVVQGGFTILGIFLFTYYWLVYRERSIRGLLLLLPEDRRATSEELWLQIEDKIGAFIRGQSLLGLAIGVISLVGYWVIGMPYTLLLGLVAGVLEFIPYLGPIITAVFAAAIGFSVSPTLGLASIAVAAVVQQLENALLVPRIMGNAVGVSPVVTLLAITGFGALFGLSGAFLAIPLAAVLQVLFNYWVQSSARSAAEKSVTGRGALARIRYQLMDLVQDVRLRLRNKEDDVAIDADKPEEDLELLLADLEALLAQMEQEPA